MDNLQYWPIERSGMIKAEDISMDPVYNAMYVPKSGTSFELTVLFSAASTHDGHVFNQRKGLVMM